MNDRSAVFRAVADDTRRRILGLLAGARRPVAELAAEFPDISRPAVSKHLRILREAGLVRETRQGRRRLYRLVRGRLAPIESWLAEIEGGGRTTRRRPAAASAAARRDPLRARPGVRPLERREALEDPDEPDWRTW